MAVTFTVEDGTGLSSSNAYASVDDVTTYITDRGGNDTWGGKPSAEKQAEIIVASDYIDARWGGQFRGYRTSSTQAMEWPRASAYDDAGYTLEEVPTAIVEALAEYVIVLQTEDSLAPNPTYDASGRPVTEEEREAGGSAGKVRTRVRFTPGGLPLTWRAYPVADGKLRELVTGGSGTMRV